MINFDESQVKETEFKVVPEDEYFVRVEKGEAQTSKQGNDMIKLQLSIIKADNGSEEFQNNKLFDYIVEGTEWTMNKVNSIMKSTGLKTKQIDHQTFVGQVGKVKVKHDEYQGKPSPKVHYWVETDNTPVEAPKIDAADSDDDIPF